MARALSEDLIADYNKTFYTVHGLFGIFAEHLQEKAGKKKGRFYGPDYRQIKTRFLYDHICKLARQGRADTICEVGFNAGLSALLFLLAAPNSRFISFDLGDFRWSRYAASALREAFPSTSHYMGTVYGSSSVTIPAADQGLKCDVMFVDGDKRPSGRFADLQNFRQRSYSGARLFFDDLAREECVNGSKWEPNSDCATAPYADTMKGYNRAAQKGIFEMMECATPVKDDIICMARFK